MEKFVMQLVSSKFKDIVRGLHPKKTSDYSLAILLTDGGQISPDVR